MKIQASEIKLTSDHHLKSEHHIEENLDIRFNPAVNSGNGGGAGNSAFSLSISRVAVETFESHSSEVSQQKTGPMTGSKLMQTKFLLEKLLGQKIEIVNFQPQDSAGVSIQEKGQPQSGSANNSVGFGLAYDRHETYMEEEHTSFQARGTVQTQEGVQIEFNLEMSMDRQFLSEEHVSIRMGDALVDPLVVNFSGKPAELLDETVQFDLDSDGKKETLHQLAPQSAYLVYDRNGDGIATNGSELFGPETGSGFSELAAYDEDDNGWIDENDKIFGQLSLWTQGENDIYQSLSEAGVGAIYLDHVSTEMQLNDANNQTRGKIQESGIFLHERGQVGTIQEIDLASVEASDPITQPA